MQVLLHAYKIRVLSLLPACGFFYHVVQSCCMHVCTTSVQALKLAVCLLQDT